MTYHNPPPFLMTSDPGSFARSTIVERKPQIIRQVIEDNQYDPAIISDLDAFRQEIADKTIRPLADNTPGATFWNQELAAYGEKTWHEVPWFFAETLFYVRLLEAIRYWQPGPWLHVDPFATQKRIQEREAVAWHSEFGDQLRDAHPSRQFEAHLHSSLWGNRADLSNFTIRQQVRGGLETEQERHNLLIDHTAQVRELLSHGLPRIDLVCDNAGKELLFDLALADFVLTRKWAGQMTFHLKNQPFFVSDAMPRDVELLIAQLESQPLGQRLAAHIAEGRLLLQTHSFWTTCRFYSQMPAPLVAELARADLIIFKGDVNYRRLLEDRHWPHDASFETLTTYVPTTFLTLRTLKGEIMVGLNTGQADELKDQDPTWLISGKRGIIQLVTKTKTV